ncbi:TatD family hydrolase [Shigella flexneri]
MAIGQCGLDFNRNFSTRKSRNALCCPATHCRSLNVPVFLHCRDAHERFMTLSASCGSTAGCSTHCFTGHAKRCRRRGAWNYIGITGGFAMNSTDWSCGNFPLIPAEKY